MKRMHMVFFVMIGAVSVASSAMAASSLKGSKPNIVHILVDDLGWQHVACYYRDCHKDEPFYETPQQ